jgi:hypothetical protein
VLPATARNTHLFLRPAYTRPTGQGAADDPRTGLQAGRRRRVGPCILHVSAHFLPFLLPAVRLAPRQRVLDVATGTGIAAEAALTVVGPEGSVVAADVSPGERQCYPAEAAGKRRGVDGARQS